jgi:signal transduction histidine kinase
VPRRRDSSPSLTERVGGRWSISLQGFRLIVIGILLSIFAGEAVSTHSVALALQWVAVAAIGVAVAGAYLFTMSLVPVYRKRRVVPVPLPITVAATVFGSLLIAASMGWAAIALGLETTINEPLRTIITALMGAVFGITVMLYLDRWDRARQSLDLLAEQQVNTAMAGISQAMLLHELRAALLDDVNDELKASREQIQLRLDSLESAVDAETLDDVAGELRGMANGAVRPLSARLWNSARDATPRVRWWKVLAETIRKAPFYPFALAGITLIANLPSYVELYGAIGIVVVVATSLTVIVITMPANRLLLRFPDRHTLIYVGALLLLELGAIPTSIVREALEPGTGGIGWVIVQMIAGSAIVLVTSAVGSWWNVRDLALDAHQRALTKQQVEATARSRAVAELVREASRLLHGSVQTRLVACAMTSERAIAQSDSVLMRASLVEAARILASIELDLPIASTLSTEVQRKVDLWDELCDITLDLDSDVALLADERQVRLAGQIVEEGISNAVRHGDADALWISLMLDAPGDLTIEIVDNGRGISAGTAGMGSALLTQATSGRWSLAETPQGTMLAATLSLRD